MNATSSLSPESLLEHQDFVRGLARSLLFDDHQVDDLVQQTWLAAIKGPPRDPGAVRGFLSRIVRSRASNLNRDESRRKRRERLAAGGRDVEVPSAAEVVEREATRARVVEAVLGLEEPYRGTVLLRFFENRTPTQIARQLRIPAATVRTRLRRALDRLREALDASHGGDRQAWAMLLVPLAAGPGAAARTGLALSAKAALWLVLVSTLAFVGITAVQRANGVSGSEPVAAAPEREGEVRSPAAAPAVAQRDEERSPIEVPDSAPASGDPLGEVGFRGRLVLPGGGPAPGRRVRLMAYDPNRAVLEGMDPLAEAVRGLRIGGGETRSDVEGRFTIRGMWPHGHYLLSTDPVDGSRLLRVVGRTPGPGELVDLGDLELFAVGSIEGRVVDGDGEPVAGALVWATDVGALPVGVLMVHEVDPQGALIVGREPAQGGDTVHLNPEWTREVGDRMQIPNVRTGADGTFELRGVVPGVHTLVVQSDRHQAYKNDRVKVVAGKPREMRDIRLRDGEAIIGRVLDARGAPVQGAQVVVAPQGLLANRTSLLGSLPQVSFGRRPRTTDAAGRFSVPGLPRARIAIAFRRGPGDPFVVVRPDDAGAEHVLRLPEPVQLAVRVTAARAPAIPVPEGKGTAGFTPTFRLLQGRLQGEMLLGGLAESISTTSRRRQEDGATVFADLLPGTYTILCSAPGYGMEVAYAEIPGEVVSIELRPAPVVELRVLGPNGEPCKGAAVFARTAEIRPWARSVLPAYARVPHWRVLPTVTARSDQTGSVRLEAVPPGEVLVTVTHPRFGARTLPLTVPCPPQVLRFEGLATVSGRLMDGSRPAEPGRYLLSFKRKGGLDEEGPHWMQRLVRPDAGGDFVVHGLAPGRYDIEVIAAPDSVRSIGTLQQYFDSAGFGIFSDLTRKSVSVVSGRNPPVVVNASRDQVEPGESGAQVRGTLFVDGAAAEGYKVRHERTNTFVSGRSEGTVVRADGRFDLGRLSTGEYRVSIEKPQGGILCDRYLVVREFEDEHLEWSITTGALSGTVRRPDGLPSPGCAVVVSGAGDNRGARGTAETDAAGRFRIEGLPSGRYGVLATDTGSGQKRTHATVTAAATGSVEIDLAPFTAIRGRVDQGTYEFADDEKPKVRLSGPDVVEDAVDIDAEGNFVFAKVLPGRYQISVYGAKKIGEATWYMTMSTDLEAPPGIKVERLRGMVWVTVPAGGLSGIRLFKPRDPGR